MKTDLDLSAAGKTVVGVVYRLYQDQNLIKNMPVGVSSAETGARHILPIGELGSKINRVEAKLILAGGLLSEAFQLVRD